MKKLHVLIRIRLNTAYSASVRLLLLYCCCCGCCLVSLSFDNHNKKIKINTTTASLFSRSSSLYLCVLCRGRGSTLILHTILLQLVFIQVSQCHSQYIYPYICMCAYRWPCPSDKSCSFFQESTHRPRHPSLFLFYFFHLRAKATRQNKNRKKKRKTGM